MGIQTTVDLTRAEAEKRLVDRYIKNHYDIVYNIVNSYVSSLDDNSIEKQLDEHFHNYNIIYDSEDLENERY